MFGEWVSADDDPFWSKIFRPEADASVLLALPSVRGASFGEPNFALRSIPNASVRQALAKQMRQYQGADIPNATLAP